MLNRKRPGLIPKAYAWKDPGRDATPGIALWSKHGKLMAHVTAKEARTLADKLHDMADHLDGGTLATPERSK